MKILWLTNILLPDIDKHLNQTVSPYGGWMNNLLDELKKRDYEISVCSPYKKESVKEISTINYYTFNSKSKETHIKERFQYILRSISPDIVHIHGTEFAHSRQLAEVCIEYQIPYVISIQGIISEITRYMSASLPQYVIRGKTLKNLIFRDNVEGLEKSFAIRGENEINLIEKSKYIIGRTEWDMNTVLSINSKLRYFHCDETLRKQFYRQDLTRKIQPRPILFCSQASYPIKGVHKLIESLAIVKESYPNILLKISGKDLFNTKGIRNFLNQNYYSKYLKKLVDDLQLMDNIQFVGVLDEENMLNTYLSTNIYVSPSAIENSSNSICEAMILGVPVISSDRGGVTSLIEHNETGLIYDFDSTESLASCIINLLDNPEKSSKIGEAASLVAKKRHSVEINTSTMIEIYQFVIRNEVLPRVNK